MSSSCKEISGTVLGRFFVEVLVFVILTFFKEGIGSNLTMPWVLGLGSWVLGLGSWVLEMRDLRRELVTGNGNW